MINFWSGPGGALMCDAPIDGVTQDLAVSTSPFVPVGVSQANADAEHAAEAMKYYGGRYFIGETITHSAAKRIAEALGGKYVGNGFRSADAG